ANGSKARGSERRLAQGISSADAELILTVLREVRKGNVSVRMPVTSTGAMARIAAEMNGMIELNERNAKNLSGIARVIAAVAEGDLSKKRAVAVRGEILELKDTINPMVDQLNAFASEVTRVAREVGTEGKLGGQAQVRGIGGVWKDLTDNVNFMASNLTAQVRNIAEVTTAVERGDLSKKITVNVSGEI